MGVSVTAEGISNILGIKSRSARYSQYLHNIYTLQACFFSFFSPLSMKFFQLVKIRLICFFALHRLYFFMKIETLKLHIAVFSRPLLHNIYSFTVVRLLLLCFKALFGDSSSLRPSRPVCLCAQEAPRWASSPGDFPPTILLHLRSYLDTGPHNLRSFLTALMLSFRVLGISSRQFYYIFVQRWNLSMPSLPAPV